MQGKVTWVDLESPTREELDAVMAEFKIDPRIKEEIICPTPYPLVVPFEDYVYLILHFPTADSLLGARNQEIDIIVGKKFIITARYEVIESIYNLHKVFEAEELLGVPNSALADTSTLLERIMRRLYGAIREEIEHTAAHLDRIEQNIFSGKERDMVGEISRAGRTLLRFETALRRHEEALGVFLGALCAKEFFGKGFAAHAAHIAAEREHCASLVSSYRAGATELRNTNDSLLTASQNEISKKLTVLAFAAVPLTIITGMFGMNIDAMPIINEPNGFWIIIGLMLLTVLSAIGIFRLKRWL